MSSQIFSFINILSIYNTYAIEHTLIEIKNNKVNIHLLYFERKLKLKYKIEAIHWLK